MAIRPWEEDRRLVAYFSFLSLVIERLLGQTIGLMTPHETFLGNNTYIVPSKEFILICDAQNINTLAIIPQLLLPPSSNLPSSILSSLASPTPTLSNLPLPSISCTTTPLPCSSSLSLLSSSSFCTVPGFGSIATMPNASRNHVIPTVIARTAVEDMCSVPREKRIKDRPAQRARRARITY